MTSRMHQNRRMSKRFHCLKTLAQSCIERMNRVGRFSVFAVALGIVAVEPPAAAGQDWTKDVRLTNNPAASGLAYNFARSVAASDDGVVHVVWYDERDGDQQVYYKRSADDGASWGRDTRLSEHTGVRMDHDPLLPAVAVCSSRVYVVWHAPRSNRQDVYLRRSIDGGITWKPTIRLSNGPGSSAHGSIAAAGDSVHVVFGDQRDGQAEVYYTRSTDAGETWGKERRLTDVPHISWVPCVAAAGKYVFLAWIDGRDGNEELYVKRSTDGGKTWGPDTRLTTNDANSWAPSVAVVGDTVHLAWFDQRHASKHSLEVEKQLDAVVELLGLPVPAVPSGVMVPHPEESARLRAEQRLRRIHEEAPGWVERGGDADKLRAIMREFEEMGKAKLPLAAERKLNQALRLLGLSATPEGGPADEGPDEFRKRVESKIKRAQAAAPQWIARGGDAAKLQATLEEFHRLVGSTEGVTYLEKERKLDEAVGLMKLDFVPREPDVKKVYYGDALGMRVRQKMGLIRSALPAWVRAGGDEKKVESRLEQFQRAMEVAFRDWEIYYLRSTDGGTTWEVAVRLTHAPNLSHRPMIAADGTGLDVVWFDNRDGNLEVYYKDSRDNGNTWSEDARLTHADGESRHAAIAVSRKSVHVIWSDERDGNTEIYYKRRAR